MADIDLLKEVGTTLKPLFGDLIKLAAADKQRLEADKTAESGAVTALRAFVKDAGNPTAGTIDQAKDALTSIDSALTELVIQSMSNAISLTPSQSFLVTTIISNVESKFAVLKLAGVFNAVARLMDDQSLNLIDSQLQGSQREIDTRTEARLVLDTLVDVAVVAGQLAIRLV